MASSTAGKRYCLIGAGACGLPVFAGGTGGLGRIVGPTGGYLIGFLPAVWLIGRISEGSTHRLFRDVLGMVLGTAMIYALGVSWLKVLTGMDWGKTLALGMLPFLPGDAIKIAAAAAVARAVRPMMEEPRTQDPEHRTQKPEARRKTQDSTTSNQNPGSRIQDPESRSQASEGCQLKAESSKLKAGATAVIRYLLLGMLLCLSCCFMPVPR